MLAGDVSGRGVILVDLINELGLQTAAGDSVLVEEDTHRRVAVEKSGEQAEAASAA